MPLRSVLDIEDVLRWTYRDELPKQRHDRDSGPGPYVSPMFRLCAHGGPIDNWSREPGMPIALGEAHPDALAVAEAVKALRAEDIDISGFARTYGTNPVGVDVDVIAEAVTSSIVALVTSRARLGARPVCSSPETTKQTAINGRVEVFYKVKRELEINGERYAVERDEPIPSTKKRGGYYPTGAFSKISYDPGRVTVYTDQAAYAAWHAALTLLADRLQGLSSVRPSRPAAPARPWLGEKDARHTGKKLTVAGTHVATKPKVYPTRAPQPQPSPVRHIDPKSLT
jgi:hypothetical protein